MDNMAELVAAALGLETPPAKGCDIVVGQECTATNRQGGVGFSRRKGGTNRLIRRLSYLFNLSRSLSPLPGL